MVKFKRKCEYCRKLTTNKKYCSNKCKGHIVGKISGKIGGERTRALYPNLFSENAILNKKNKVGLCGMTHKEHVKAGRKGAEINKKNKTGFYDSKIQSMGGKIGGYNSQKTLKKLKLGFYDPKVQSMGGKKGWKKTNETNKKNNTSVYNPEIQRMGLLASRQTIIVDKLVFPSRPEAEIYFCINEQIETLIYKKNYEVSVGRKRIDFIIKKYKCAIEVHPVKDDNYFNFRRSILDNNDYKNYNLVVIK